MVFLGRNTIKNSPLDISIDHSFNSQPGRCNYIMAPARPATAEWEIENMTAWLKYIQDQADTKHGVDSAYIHPRVLTYSTDKQKTEWIGYEEGAEELDVFAKLGKAKKGGRKTWVAVLKGPNESYVGKETKGSGQHQWDLVDSHMWTVALVNRGKKGEGKDLFLFDCDVVLPTEDEVKHAKDLETQLQRVFVAEVEKWDFKLSGVFLGSAGDGRAGRGIP